MDRAFETTVFRIPVIRRASQQRRCAGNLRMDREGYWDMKI